MLSRSQVIDEHGYPIPEKLISFQLNLLFVCSRNQWRSPTAERIFRSGGHQTRSAGTSESAVTRINGGLIRWADLIFVMEKEHKRRMLEKFGQELADKTIIILDIPDEYGLMDQELILTLKDSVGPYIQ